MASKRISELTAVATPEGSIEIPCVQAGITKKVTLSQTQRKPSVAPSLGGIAGVSGFVRAYRIPLTGGSGGSAGFQRQLLVGEGSGSTGADFHIGGNSQRFPSGEDVGGDFKFVKGDGTNVGSKRADWTIMYETN